MANPKLETLLSYVPLFHDLAARFGRPVPGGILIPITLRQDEIACMSATSRESANRAIGRLVELGRIGLERRGRYVVRTPIRLVRT